MYVDGWSWYVKGWKVNGEAWGLKFKRLEDRTNFIIATTTLALTF